MRWRRAGIGLAAACLLLTGCAAEPVTKEAKEINSLYLVVTVIAVLIWAGVIAAMLYSVVRFRKKPGDDELPPQFHGNTTAEVVWTVIPTIIVLILFGMSYATLRSVDKVSKDEDLAAIIHVRGFQWFWEFDYGTNAAGSPVVIKPTKEDSRPTLVVPAGERVRLVLTTDNVNHSFYVPNFLFKRDLTAGKTNQFEFQVDIPGEYEGQCAELCGTEHAEMTFKVRAVQRGGPGGFDEFIANPPKLGCQGDEELTPTPELSSPDGKIEFDKNCLVVPANQPFPIKYVNGGGAPHNVAITTGKAASDPAGQILLGLPEARTIESGEITYQAPALQPGSYTFFCQVHPGMAGELQAKEA
jgi:cytochrome c oxidase subunit II